ncbi:hypothetical protein MKX03_020839, partial [Papaver bracteatum]
MKKTKKAAGAGSEEKEEICRKKITRWRCKNASADNELHYCQKHYDEKMKLPPDELRCSIRNGITEGKIGSWRCNNASADNELHYCDKHYKDYNDLELERKKQLPPDEERCSQTGGKGIYRYRCKSFRMSHGADDSVPKTRHCEKHYNLRLKYYQILKEKKRSGETRGGLKRRREKVTVEEDDDT